MSRIVNRRNALIGWAMWQVWRRRARRRAGQVFGEEARPRRWGRRVVTLLAAVLAAVGVAAAWRKLRGGGEEEWVAPELVDQPAPAEPSPLTSVQPDDDIPPAA